VIVSVCHAFCRNPLSEPAGFEAVKDDSEIADLTEENGMVTLSIGFGSSPTMRPAMCPLLICFNICCLEIPRNSG